MTTPPGLVWFRLDLRLADQPALDAARRRGGPVIPIYIHAPDEEGAWAPGAASRWWLHQSLVSLTARLERLGSTLILRRGSSSLAALRDLVRETGARALFWNRRYEPAAIERDQQIKKTLRAEGLTVESFNSALLFEPWTVSNKAGRPFQVFTPFWRHCMALAGPGPALPAPRSLVPPGNWPRSESLPALDLEPRIDWTQGIRSAWQPGEPGAARNLDRFREAAWSDYSANRDRPDLEGTSRLSPHLHFGEIGPRQIWHRLKAHAARIGVPESDWRRNRFLAELGWREFAHHLLVHFPTTPDQPLRAEFARFPWRRNALWLKRWQRGRTGYPIVDAGMRQLWATGWMHNRVRMIVASFLVKDLLLDWRAGARWFWDMLVDADLANNTLGWQWSAGCGADAAPYFRVFNPVRQGEKFDPEGEYIRRWVPELDGLSTRWIHQPWEAPETARVAAGLELDRTYPAPVVSHAIAREVALETFQRMKSRRPSD
jgi:deoxyribodipyrimidine photo-lyase